MKTLFAKEFLTCESSSEQVHTKCGILRVKTMLTSLFSVCCHMEQQAFYTPLSRKRKNRTEMAIC